MSIYRGQFCNWVWCYLPKLAWFLIWMTVCNLRKLQLVVPLNENSHCPTVWLLQQVVTLDLIKERKEKKRKESLMRCWIFASKRYKILVVKVLETWCYCVYKFQINHNIKAWSIESFNKQRDPREIQWLLWHLQSGGTLLYKQKSTISSPFLDFVWFISS